MYCCLTPCALARLIKLIEDLRSLIEVDGYRPSEADHGVGRRPAQSGSPDQRLCAAADAFDSD